MSYKSLLFLIGFSLYVCCCNHSVDVSDLEKLDGEEILSLSIRGEIDIQDAIFINESNVEIGKSDLDRLTSNEVGLDYYRNADSIIKVIKYRERNNYDDVISALQHNFYEIDVPLDMLKLINCDSLESEIEKQFQIIPGSKFNDLNITEYNYYNLRQERLKSILTACRKINLDSIDFKSKRKLWLEYQHASDTVRSFFYYPQFYNMFQNESNAQFMALSHDRILMNAGYKQLYGSQIYNGQLWPIKDTVSLDSIRLSMGMEPMSKYLERFGL